MLRTAVGRLRLVGWLEGISYLLLLFVAMPLKYLAGMPLAVRIAGSAHGALFVLFVLAAVHAAVTLRWSVWRLLGALVASVLPFGPFVFEARVLRDSGEGK